MPMGLLMLGGVVSCRFIHTQKNIHVHVILHGNMALYSPSPKLKGMRAAEQLMVVLEAIETAPFGLNNALALDE